MEMNVIHSMAWENYLASPGVSQSMLKFISAPFFPAHYKARFITGDLQEEDTPAKQLGSLVHRLILLPDSMEGAFHVRPEGMKFTTKEGMAWKADHQDRPILTADEALSAKRMRDAVWSHPQAAGLLRSAQTEVCVFADDREGNSLKGRIDALPPKANTIPDVKTVERIDEHSLESSILKFRWYVQGAFYRDLLALAGIKRAVFAFIFVEKNPPYCVTVRTLPEEVEAMGRKLYKADLARLRDCMERNHWPSDPNDGQDIYLPARVMQSAQP